jgi:hypothetical protein
MLVFFFPNVDLLNVYLMYDVLIHRLMRQQYIISSVKKKYEKLIL